MPLTSAGTTAPDRLGPELATRPQRRDSETARGDNEPTLDGAFADDGVDLTVIRWMLDRSPEERLRAAQQLIDAAESKEAAGRDKDKAMLPVLRRTLEVRRPGGG